MRSGIVSLVYLVVGVVIASSHHYFAHASTLKPILSALLAIVLWPLLLLGTSTSSSSSGRSNAPALPMSAVSGSRGELTMGSERSTHTEGPPPNAGVLSGRIV